MRALLYASTTAADLGHTVFDEKLPELRRFAGLRGFEIAGEYTDSVPRGVGKRTGFAELCAAIEAGKGDVLVALSLANLAWRQDELYDRLHRLGVPSRCHLVLVRTAFDTTTTSGMIRLMDMCLGFKEHHVERARERQQIGILQSSARRQGVAFTGRPRVVLNIAELKVMWEGGLQPEMLRKLEALGAGVSKGTLSRAILNAVEAGDLDPKAHAAAVEKRGGKRRGGRPSPAIEIDRAELVALRLAGNSAAAIAKKLSTPKAALSVWRVRKELAEAAAVTAANDVAELQAAGCLP